MRVGNGLLLKEESCREVEVTDVALSSESEEERKEDTGVTGSMDWGSWGSSIQRKEKDDADSPPGVTVPQPDSRMIRPFA